MRRASFITGLAPVLTFVAICLFGQVARADTYNLCLWVRFDMIDDHASDDYGNGVSGPLGLKYIQARHMAMEVWDYSNPNAPSKQWEGALNGDGCAQVSAMDIITDYRLAFSPIGWVAGDNHVRAFNSLGQIPIYWTDEFTTPGAGGHGSTIDIHVTSLLHLPQIHATVAYIMDDRFRGNMDDEFLSLWYYENGPCSGSGPRACEVDGYFHIHLDGADPMKPTRRKTVIAHEYGHVNLLSTVVGGSDALPSDCDLGGGAHNMWSLEYQSCAAMEGWAHFVAADAWNSHSGTNPGGWINYPNGSTTSNLELNVESANGSFDAAYCSTNYYGGGACPTTRGVELDWLRMWWDYHTNNTAVTSGSPPSHGRLQQEIDAAPNWSDGPFNVANRIRSGVQSISGQVTRFNSMLSANDISG